VIARWNPGARNVFSEFSAVRGVYALIDPRSGVVMYVGQSDHFRYPYMGHLNAKRESNPRKNESVAVLDALGLKPTLSLVKKSYGPKKDEVEIKEICRLHRLGQCHLNMTMGGPGPRAYRRKKKKAKTRFTDAELWGDFDPDYLGPEFIAAERMLVAPFGVANAPWNSTAFCAES
jgi:hypothetical protein